MSSLSELADLVSGTVIGDPDCVIENAVPAGNATQGDISFIDHQDKAKLLKSSQASAFVVPANFTTVETVSLIQVDDVQTAFQTIFLHFHPQRISMRAGVSPQAIIGKSAQLGENVEVHAGAIIGDEVVIGKGSTIHSGVNIMAGCVVGENVTIYPNVVLYDNTMVGNDCILHSGVVLGACGFGYRFADGRHHLIPQLGNVVIEDRVEIGASTTIDRGTYGPTKIGEGTKIDNLVMIAHNCQIGKHNMICSQVGIAGSATTGDYVVIAGQVGVRDHITIGTGCTLGAMAGVMNDVPPGETYVGIPATPVKEQFKIQAALAKIPEMRKQLKTLHRKHLDELSEVKKAS